MKKFLINIGFVFLLFVVIASCKKDLEEKFNNPEKSTKAEIPGFFTAMLNNDRIRPSYWNVSTFLLRQPAIYSQTTFFVKGSDMYQSNDGYIGGYWEDFYRPNESNSGTLALYRLMEAAYNSQSEEEKASNEIFMKAGLVVLYDQASKMVDLWGDIPFSEAGSLQSSSTIKNPKFDDQGELYASFIAGLEDAASYFGSASGGTVFSKYDILLGGSVKQWQRYANSVKLRLLMRTSFVDEGGSKAKVQEMLGNSTAYPLIDGGNMGKYSPSSEDVLLQPLTDYISNLGSAFNDWANYSAPDYMLNTLMLPSSDPRIPYMFDKYGQNPESDKFVQNKEYKAISVDYQGDQTAVLNQYSVWDSVTFLQNSRLPGIVMTAPEVNFLKAEAFERWGGGDAKAAYETAVRQSIAFYYYLYKSNAPTSGSSRFVAEPTEEQITTFLSKPGIVYTGTSADKLAKIWNQKWLHFGVLQSDQAWAEYRRTNYPILTFPRATLQGYEAPPTRLMYPSSETGYNNANYQAVAAKNTRTTKIFWDVN